MKRISFVKAALALVLGVAAAVHADPALITVTQTLVGGHGTSNSNNTFEAWSETNIPLTITANTGYVIAQIATNGVPVAGAFNQATCSFNAVFLDDATLTASFARRTRGGSMPASSRNSTGSTASSMVPRTCRSSASARPRDTSPHRALRAAVPLRS